MTSSWFTKHAALLPALVISFYAFTLDSNGSTLQDNKLKNEINNLRSTITTSGQKIRFIIVLIGHGGYVDDNTEDRMATIRKATGLEAKNQLFFLPPNLSEVEKRAFVGTILSSVQPLCIDYYRELSKHARRKRNRGSVPPPTAPPTSGTSQTLTAQGWNTRYEIKLGIFAEFRQEMDVAERNYEAAYESLMGDDVFESISSWSPRFNEARLLADVLALRMLRCLLWTAHTTFAAQTWLNHKARMQDLVDRKGKGSNNYGWEAWEARWSIVMAEMIERVDVPIFHVTQQQQSPDASLRKPLLVYVDPEKVSASDRVQPWEMLHHEGFWLYRAAEHIRTRRRLAKMIPEDDRNPPGQSPASLVASKAHLYDVYLCAEPHYENALPGRDGFNHTDLLLTTLRGSLKYFDQRGQSHMVKILEFEIAKEYMLSERFNKAIFMLKPFWQSLSWRTEGWWSLVGEVGWALRDCCRHVGDGKTLLAVEWELLSSLLPARTDWYHDFPGCIENVPTIKSKPNAEIQADSVAPTLLVSFAFGNAEGHAGEPLTSQVTIKSLAHTYSSPITVAEIQVMFEGGLRNLKISHSQTPDATATDQKGTITLSQIPLDEDSTSSNLEFHPGCTKIFSISRLPRSAGEVFASSVTLIIREPSFDFTIRTPLHEGNNAREWWIQKERLLVKKTLGDYLKHTVNILPKPPKVQLGMPNYCHTYYADEHVKIDVTILNGEDEDVDLSLDIRMLAGSGPLLKLQWHDQSDRSIHSNQDTDDSHINDIRGHILDRSIGRLPVSASKTQAFSFKGPSSIAEYTLEIQARYRLDSDPDTLVTKIVKSNIIFDRPFKVTYDFLPVVHRDPWPNYFNILDGNELVNDAADGLTQEWALSATLASSVTDNAVIEAVGMQLLEAKNDARCSISEPGEKDEGEVVVAPNDIIARTFMIEVQKKRLEDRRSSSVYLQLSVRWRRSSTSSLPTTTTFPVPHQTIPFGEPRVLASATASETMPSLVHLEYLLENPSMHLLTFSLVMEASEEFAFSGSKTKTVQLLPLSRCVVKYRILPSIRGKWFLVGMRVHDLGFGKVLKVMGTGGLRTAGKGIMIWADAEA